MVWAAVIPQLVLELPCTQCTLLRVRPVASLVRAWARCDEGHALAERCGLGGASQAAFEEAANFLERSGVLPLRLSRTESVRVPRSLGGCVRALRASALASRRPWRLPMSHPLQGVLKSGRGRAARLATRLTRG